MTLNNPFIRLKEQNNDKVLSAQILGQGNDDLDSAKSYFKVLNYANDLGSDYMRQADPGWANFPTHL